MRSIFQGLLVIGCLLASGAISAYGAEQGNAGVQATVAERFQDAGVSEVPDFQKHVVPLFGRLGCNGRACHGSFQGRGGFRLSLFGYDFKADHDSLFDKESPRVDTANPLESLIIAKPTDEDMHEGGLRYEKGSWQYHLLRRWVEGGAKFDEENVRKLTTLQVIPAEIQFEKTGQTVQLKAIAVWEDGTKEDVTPLCRFQSNDDQVATIDEQGLVTATNKGDTHVVVSYDKAVIPIAVIRPVTDLIGAKYPQVPTPTKIDELVVEKLRKLGIVPSDVCTDAEFLRRVSLDLTGSLPTADEVRAFLADPAPTEQKRKQKVEELLESPAYAAWWTTKLCDFTGNNDERLNNVGVVRGRATQEWWDWINKRVSDNVPYDQIAAGIILGKSRDDGESYLEFCSTMSDISRGKDGRSFAERDYMPHYWARTNVRQPEERAIAFAYSFMGARIECAQCHKHPFDQWSKDDFDQFKRFFTTIVAVNNSKNLRAEERGDYERLMKEVGLTEARMNNNERQRLLANALKEGKVVPFPEVYVNRPASPARGKQGGNNRRAPAAAAPTAKLLGGETLDLSQLEDARQPLMDWLRDKNNRYFAPAFVNRVWATYFHAGIVNPTDDLNLANPASNQALLDYLSQGFVASGFDMKWLHREITASRTYQLSWVSNETNQLDERNFSRAVPRRLPAEVAVDAVYTALVGDARAATMRADLDDRAITIPGASARVNRGGGQGFALGVFGRSIRESNCDCDRSMEASLLQTVYLQNDNDIRAQLEARDSWVNQVTRDLAKQTKAAPQNGGDNEEVAAQIQALERRVERMQKQNNVKEAKRLQVQLSALRKEQATRQRKAAETKPVVTEKVSAETAESLVETAYLRSLSRFPTPDERTIALNYLGNEADVAVGLRDLMWALVNTKEFIVNH